MFTWLAIACAQASAPPCEPVIWTRGRSIVSGERLVLVQYAGNYEGDLLDVHVLYLTLSGLSTPPNPYGLPSLAYDQVVADNVTVGAAGGFTAGNPEGSAWLASIRGGYLWPISDGVSLWWRAGLGYYAAYAADPAAERVTGLFITLAPEYVFAIGSHIAVTLGATGDIPVTGVRRRQVWFAPDRLVTVTEKGKGWAAISLMLGALYHF